MTKFFNINSLRFIILILAQILICNNINFLGSVNPFIYILFIILFPIYENRLPLLSLSFLLGLIIDIFSDSGGVHAAASVSLAYVRPIFLKTAFGVQFQYQNIRFNSADLGNLLIYLLLGTLFHHIVLFSLEIFNLQKIVLILKKTILSALFSTFISYLILILFVKNTK